MKKSTSLLFCVLINTIMCYYFPKEGSFFIAAFVCIVGYFIVKLLEEKL